MIFYTEVFMKVLVNKRKWMLIGIDFLIYTAVYALIVILQSYSSAGNHEPIGYFFNFIIFYLAIFVARGAVRMYSSVWRYANSMTFLKMVFADAFGGCLALVITLAVRRAYIGVWMSVALVSMCNVVTLVSRFMYQQKYRYERETKQNVKNKINVAIVGAGQVGTMLADELVYNPISHYKPICFIDQNKEKIGNTISGLRVYSDDDSIIHKLSELSVQEIIIALPKITNERAKELHEFYAKSGCKVKIYDAPLNEDGNEIKNARRVIRELQIEDLLFRDALQVTDDNTTQFYKGKTVLVTGGGGSIGSELCRQIAKCEPGRLIVFDIYENNAYDIQQELKREYGDTLDLCVEIGSVRDVQRLEAVFSYYRPEIVFHAAAHKHVPLMEHSNSEAIKNNVLGTYNTANVAEKYGTERFILISTDKAVNPTNVMGASKRLCEMVVQCRTDSNTRFAAVRFGNVLGSNGSVIPLFKRQIEKGGPITITDKRIIRYFMTIPEASGLVMQAGAMAKSNQLFVLDMGKPVKIIDLAENMIKLSGLIPYRDIEIVETGLRPGEKLYEELLIRTEKLEKTENNMIFIEQDLPLLRKEVEEKLRVLRRAVKEAENEIGATSIRDAMMRVVPTFRLPEEINEKAQNSEEMKLAEK